MSDKPILFSASMVRAILREIETPGTGKTQTRRIFKPRGRHPSLFTGEWTDGYVLDPGNEDWRQKDIPIKLDDRLWVRETLQAASNDQGRRWLSYASDGKDVWPLTEWIKARDSIPSIHMPRWASRLTLIVTDVRVQRLQEISEADAIAEGADPHPCGGCGEKRPDGRCIGCLHPFYTNGFQTLWDSLNADRGYGWEANPWVVAYRFRPVLGNIDQIGGDA